MSEVIEPSDVERAEWPETTRAYVEALEDALDHEKMGNAMLFENFLSISKLLAKSSNRADHLLMQAQIWASEAKTQRATVREIYQVTTFASGEPGDWNGAKPVRELMARFVTACHEVARLRDRLGEMYLLHGDPNSNSQNLMGIRGIVPSNDKGES